HMGQEELLTMPADRKASGAVQGPRATCTCPFTAKLAMNWQAGIVAPAAFMEPAPDFTDSLNVGNVHGGHDTRVGSADHRDGAAAIQARIPAASDGCHSQRQSEIPLASDRLGWRRLRVVHRVGPPTTSYCDGSACG